MRYCVEKNFRDKRNNDIRREDVSIIRKNNNKVVNYKSNRSFAGPFDVYESLYY